MKKHEHAIALIRENVKKLNSLEIVLPEDIEKAVCNETFFITIESRVTTIEEFKSRLNHFRLMFKKYWDSPIVKQGGSRHKKQQLKLLINMGKVVKLVENYDDLIEILLESFNQSMKTINRANKDDDWVKECIVAVSKLFEAYKASDDQLKADMESYNNYRNTFLNILYAPGRSDQFYYLDKYPPDKAFNIIKKIIAKNGGFTKIYDLSSGNPSLDKFPLPDAFEKALLKSYTATRGSGKVLKAIALFANLQFLDISKGYYSENNVLCIDGGGLSAIYFIIEFLASELDELNALIPVPTFWEYGRNIVLRGGGFKHLRTTSPFRFLPRPDEIESNISADTSLLILCSPNNPTGENYSRKELIEIVNIVKSKKKEYGRDIYIVADEVFKGLWFDAEDYPDIGEIAKDCDYERWLIRITSWSKDRSPGPKQGFVLAHETFIEKFEERVSHAFTNHSRYDDAIILDMYVRILQIVEKKGLDRHFLEEVKDVFSRVREEDLSPMLERLEINMITYDNFIKKTWNSLEPPSRYIYPKGGFNFFVPIADLRFPSKLRTFGFIKKLCNDHKLCVYSGEMFGIDSERDGFWYRLSVSQPDVDELIDNQKVLMKFSKQYINQ